MSIFYSAECAVTRLDMRGLTGVKPALAGQEVRDALRAFLEANTSVKKLDLSSNSMSAISSPFFPRWHSFVNAAPTQGLVYCEGDQGPGWYLSDEVLCQEFTSPKSPSPDALATASSHPAWALGGLALNKGLTELNVQYCDLADAGYTALGHALRQNRTLISLKLDGNRVTLEGLKGFKGCLYGNKKVDILKSHFCSDFTEE